MFPETADERKREAEAKQLFSIAMYQIVIQPQRATRKNNPNAGLNLVLNKQLRDRLVGGMHHRAFLLCRQLLRNAAPSSQATPSSRAQPRNTTTPPGEV